jgi:hypothetical protein
VQFVGLDQPLAHLICEEGAQVEVRRATDRTRQGVAAAFALLPGESACGIRTARSLMLLTGCAVSVCRRYPSLASPPVAISRLVEMKTESVVINRRAELVFADDTHLDDSGARFGMKLPSLRDSRTGMTRSVGGFMCVPLLALVLEDRYVPLSALRDKGANPLLLIDTGTEGFFCLDDTGGPGHPGTRALPSVSDIVARHAGGWGTGKGMYGVIIGDGADGGATFEILIPEEWRGNASQPGYENIVGEAPEIAPLHGASERTQIFVVGNLFLEGVAVTYSAGESSVYFSHLDGGGKRTPGPRSQDAAVAGFVAATSRSHDDPPLPRPVEGARTERSSMPSRARRALRAKPSSFYAAMNGGSGGATLSDVSRVAAPLPPGQRPRSNVRLPLSLVSDLILKDATTSGGKVARAPREKTVATAQGLVYLPCLDFELLAPQGGRPRGLGTGPTPATPITGSLLFDSASGVTFMVPSRLGGDVEKVASSLFEPCEGESSTCLGSGHGSIAEFFEAFVPGAPAPKRCKDARSCYERSSSDDDNARIASRCCDVCCLPEASGGAPALRAESVITCGLSYCTGAVAYVPSMVFLRLGKGDEALHVRAFAGNATVVCEPMPLAGVLAGWYWMNPLEDSQGRLVDHGCLPFYALQKAGHAGAKDVLNNYTFKLWRQRAALGGDDGASIRTYGMRREEAAGRTPSVQQLEIKNMGTLSEKGMAKLALTETEGAVASNPPAIPPPSLPPKIPDGRGSAPLPISTPGAGFVEPRTPTWWPPYVPTFPMLSPPPFSPPVGGPPPTSRTPPEQQVQDSNITQDGAGRDERINRADGHGLIINNIIGNADSGSEDARFRNVGFLAAPDERRRRPRDGDSQGGAKSRERQDTETQDTKWGEGAASFGSAGGRDGHGQLVGAGAPVHPPSPAPGAEKWSVAAILGLVGVGVIIMLLIFMVLRTGGAKQKIVLPRSYGGGGDGAVLVPSDA